MVSETKPSTTDIAERQDPPQYSDLPARPPLLIPVTAYRLLVVGTIIAVGSVKVSDPYRNLTSNGWLFILVSTLM